jgi:hypothetical protein
MRAPVEDGNHRSGAAGGKHTEAKNYVMADGGVVKMEHESFNDT